MALDKTYSSCNSFTRLASAIVFTAATLLPYQARADQCMTLESCITDGNTHYEAGHVDEAIDDFKQALGMNPKPEQLLRLYNNLAVCFLSRGEPSKAIMQYDLFLTKAADDNSIRSREEVNKLIADLRVYDEGIRLREQERGIERSGQKSNYGAAIEKLHQAHGLARTRYGRGVVLRDLGRTYELAKEYGLAAESFEGYLREFGQRAADRAQFLEKIEQLREWEQNPPLQIPVQKIPVHSIPTNNVPESVKAPEQVPTASFLQQHLWSTVAAGAAVALGAGTLASYLSANAAYNDLRDRCDGNASCDPSDADAIKSKDTITTLLGISSALALGTAGALFYFELPKNVTAGVTSDGVNVKVKY